MKDSEIKKLRKHVDQVDKGIVSLLNKRFNLIERIGIYKKKNNVSVRDVQREKEMMEERKRWAKVYNVGESFVEKLFSVLFSEARNKQRDIIKK